ncbi:MAG: FAD-dependent oxidoreductase, partial [Candidatus Cloacimonadales bacterium]
MIEIILNGEKIKTSKGKTILEVARENGIEIPTLCHDEELKPFGSCWTCAVKVKDRRGFVTSCGTEAVDGMEVFTETEEVKNARKMALELLLSDHYADCEAPCKLACPDQVDVQSYLALIANGQHHEAVKVIKETLPMPLSIGRVCPAFCEAECRRSIVDEPIAIRQLKRHAADFDLNDTWSYVSEKKEASGYKVAIIGAGPSGLSCGYYLSNEGHAVTVYEAAPQAGGWLRYGIPEYRLPKTILDQEIKLMCANGMRIKYNQQVGKDISLQDLSQKFDAVYLAIGAQKAVPMRVKGSKLGGCYLGVDFLKDLALGKELEIGKHVAVIGGGNTAIDCARTARRLGKDVTLIYRRTRKEMPAESYEVDAAEEEGVKFYFLTNPVENIGKNKKLSKIKLEKMELGEPDESGRRRPVGTGEFFEEKFETAIAAISQTPEIDFLAEDKNKIAGKDFPLTRWNTAESLESTMYMGFSNLFAGGDFRRGPATAIEAIADGRIAARSINRLLNGEMMEEQSVDFNSKKAEKLSEVDPEQYAEYQQKARALMPELKAGKRSANFEEVETGFSEEAAREEAARCLECGCNVNSSCDLRRYSTEYKIEPEKFLGFENKHPIDDSHPFIRRDANKCIKCGRCVRICAEVQGPGVLGYIYRGFASYVAPEFGESLTQTDCSSCGKCIEVCPVGALLPKNQTVKISPHHTETYTQNCGLCGTGCKIDVETLGNKIVQIKPAAERGFNERNLCFNGKFGWQVFEQDRLTTAYKRHNTHLIEMENMDDAIDKIIEENETAKSKKIYISPVCTNEELLIMKQVAQNIGADISS